MKRAMLSQGIKVANDEDHLIKKNTNEDQIYNEKL